MRQGIRVRAEARAKTGDVDRGSCNAHTDGKVFPKGRLQMIERELNRDSRLSSLCTPKVI
jgi:hypothetical protein